MAMLFNLVTALAETTVPKRLPISLIIFLNFHQMMVGRIDRITHSEVNEASMIL